MGLYATVSFHTKPKHSQNATQTGSSKDLCRQTVCSPPCALDSVSHDVLMIVLFKSYKTERGEMGDDASCGQTEK